MGFVLVFSGTDRDVLNVERGVSYALDLSTRNINTDQNDLWFTYTVRADTQKKLAAASRRTFFCIDAALALSDARLGHTGLAYTLSAFGYECLKIRPRDEKIVFELKKFCLENIFRYHIFAPL